MSQTHQILTYIRENGSITPQEAYRLGCMRLAARVDDLKHRGHKIEKIMEHKRGKRYARYYLA
jgi:hypothetical protein